MRVKVIKGLVTHNNKEYAVGKSFTCSKADGKHLSDAGFVKEITDKKSTSNKKDKTPLETMKEGELYELQAVAQELNISIEGKSYEELLEEVELAREIGLKE